MSTAPYIHNYMDDDLATTMHAVHYATQSHVTPVFIGDPGLGKTAEVEQFAEAMNYRLVILLGNSADPTDIAGMPARIQVPSDNSMEDGDQDWITVYGMTEWAWYAKQDGLGNTGYDGTLIFLDELNTSPPAVQAAMLSVLQSRRTPSGYKFPDTTYFIAAMNDPEDAADGFDLASPLANRLLHLEWNPSRDSWYQGMLDNWGNGNLDANEAVNRSIIVSFLKEQSQFLDKKPDNSEDAGKAWPSRRTWHKTAQVISKCGTVTDIDANLRAKIVKGLVGAEASSKLTVFLNGYTLPDPQDVLDDPDSIDWAEMTADKTYAVLSSVLAYADDDQANSTANVLIAAAESGRQDAVSSFVKPVMEKSNIDSQEKTKVLKTIAKKLTPVIEGAGLLAGSR